MLASVAPKLLSPRNREASARVGVDADAGGEDAGGADAGGGVAAGGVPDAGGAVVFGMGAGAGTGVGALLPGAFVALPAALSSPPPPQAARTAAASTDKAAGDEWVIAP